MSWVASPAKPGMKVCDTFSHFDAPAAQALRDDGFEAIGLYAEQASAADLVACASVSLGVWWILEGLAQTTQPTAALGSQMASAGVSRLRSLGVPTGIGVFSDLEGAGRLPGDWVAFANAVADALAHLQFVPGAYIGNGIGLTSLELHDLHVVRYGQSGSRIVDRFDRIAEPYNGWCWLQGRPLDIVHPCGLQIDVGALWDDYRFRAMPLMVWQ